MRKTGSWLGPFSLYRRVVVLSSGGERGVLETVRSETHPVVVGDRPTALPPVSDDRVFEEVAGRGGG